MLFRCKSVAGRLSCVTLTLIATLLVSCGDSPENSQGENFLSQVDQVSKNAGDDAALLTFFDDPVKPVTAVYQNLPQGSTSSKGWVKTMMQTDLQSGIVGALDDLYPGITRDDLYRTARRAGLDDVPEMGDLVLTGEPWEQSIMWWNAETAGNWWDGFVRHAFMTGDEGAKRQAQSIVNNLIESQDTDGYIGIYKPELRYQHEGSNGELWAQTTAFRTLLGYYELTGDSRALEAVIRGMAVTMKNYGEDGVDPFDLANAFGGVTHGLMLTDVCEALSRITGEKQYDEYIAYLYRAFSTHNINRAFNDLRYPFLMERDSLFTGHGVHTYEHIRTLLAAYYVTGYPEMEVALDNAIHKLDQVVLPSGAGHGNEWLLGITADATYTSAEYCSMLELRNSLASLYQKTGNVKYADMAELLTYKGMMGFRNEEGTAIAYGKSDNCYVMDGHHHGENEKYADVRYKYSPTHSDPAVCCVPNYSRNLPYFLDQQWLRSDDGFVLAAYGPSELQTDFNGQKVTIEQITDYPFSDEVLLVVNVERPVEFSIGLRRPSWSSSVSVDGHSVDIESSENMITLERKWESSDTIRVRFDNQILQQAYGESEVFMQRGPLVYAYPIPHRTEVIKEYINDGFSDYYCYPLTEEFKSMTLPFQSAWEHSSSKTNSNITWHNADCKLVADELELVPVGQTVLRRVTFAR